MTPDAIPVKTDQAWLILRSGEFAGTRAQRALLIMVDGHKSVGRLTPAMISLGLSSADLQKLADAGLVDWLRSETARSPGHPHQAGAADSQAASGIPDTDVAPLVDAAVLLQRTVPADFSDDPAGPTKARARLDIEL